MGRGALVGRVTERLLTFFDAGDDTRSSGHSFLLILFPLVLNHFNSSFACVVRWSSRPNMVAGKRTRESLVAAKETFDMGQD